MYLGRTHVTEPEQLAEQISEPRRDRHAVALAHRLDQLGIGEAIWRLDGCRAASRDLFARRPKLQSERFHTFAASLGNLAMTLDEPSDPDFECLRQDRLEGVDL